MIVIATITGTATATLTSTTIATVTATPYTNLGRIARYRLYNDSVIFSMTGTLTVTVAVTGTVTATATSTVSIIINFCWQRVSNRIRFLYEFDIFSS